MKRWDTEMNGDDLIIEEAPDGRWVDADEVLARIAELEDQVKRYKPFGILDEQAARIAELEALLDKWPAGACTPGERAVLDASARAPESELRLVLNMGGHPSWEVDHARAELSRREASNTDTFRSVDSGRYTSTLSEAKP